MATIRLTVTATFGIAIVWLVDSDDGWYERERWLFAVIRLTPRHTMAAATHIILMAAPSIIVIDTG